jgi:hypothetical protein
VGVTRAGLPLVILAATACSFSTGDLHGTAYRCGPGDTCPDGLSCDQGVCIAGDASAPIDTPMLDAAPACAGNLVSNPSFETGTSGWAGVGGPITQVDVAHDGEHAAQKCYDGSYPYYNVSDNPDSVTSTAVGNVYRLAAWLRSDTTQSLRAVIREKDSLGEPLEQTTTIAILKPDWQQVTVEHQVIDPTATIVEVYFSVSEQPIVGACFQLDDICFLTPP